MDITLQTFMEQFPRLVIGGAEFPRKPLPQHILLVSVVCGFASQSRLSEAEVNDGLQGWLLRFGGNFGLDHAWLRRLLVDEGYLVRDPSGAWYQVQPSGRNVGFDAAIRQVDLEAQVAAEREKREARKRAHSGLG